MHNWYKILSEEEDAEEPNDLQCDKYCLNCYKMAWLFFWGLCEYMSWIFVFQIENAPSLLCEVNTKARLTCLAVWLKKDFETEQIPDEATPSSSQGITIEFS